MRLCIVRVLGAAALGCAALLSRFVLKTHAATILAVLVILFSIKVVSQAKAQDEAAAATRPPQTVAVLLSRRTDRCFTNGYDEAIRKMMLRERDRINARGGIKGAPLEVKFFEAERGTGTTEQEFDAAVSTAREALQQSELLAVVGLASSDHVKRIVEAVGNELTKSNIAYIADNSASDVFQDYPTVFSTRPAQTGADGRARIVAEFLKTQGAARVGVFLNEGREYSKAFGNDLIDRLGQDKIAWVGRHDQFNGSDEADGLDARIAALKANEPDFVVTSTMSSQAEKIIEKMGETGLRPRVFVLGSLSSMKQSVLDNYPSDIFELTTDDLPEVFNSKLGNLVQQGEPGEWVFEGRPVDEAKGWSDGQCKPRDEGAEDRDPLDAKNLKAIKRGAQYADVLAMIAAGASDAPAEGTIADRRKAVVSALKDRFAAGKGAFRGEFNIWSFDPQSRVAVRPLFVVIRPPTIKARQLAQQQFLRLRDNSLQKIDTLYLDIDLIRAHRVDENEKTFFAEFYLALRKNAGADISRLEFTNAYLNPLNANGVSHSISDRAKSRTGGRHLIIQELHDGNDNAAFPDRMQIYRVAGRFLFDPDLSNYPFDKQQFSIDIQPRSGAGSFVIQPPPDNLRDGTVDSDDWQPVSKFVGAGEDFVPMIDAFTHAPSVVPFYTSKFVWVMKREVTDYLLRVGVPLAFILIVAYVSIFIPQSNFEAIVTIQVTALLSAVALYLSLPQLEADTATLSDRMFLLDYLLVSLMIVISIARINKFVVRNKWLRGGLYWLHIIGAPIAVAGTILYLRHMTLTT